MRGARALLASCLLLCAAASTAASVAGNNVLTLTELNAAAWEVEALRELSAATTTSHALEEFVVRRLSAMTIAATGDDATLRTQAQALFNLYRKVDPTQVATWGTTPQAQFDAFYSTEFPKILTKAQAARASVAPGTATTVSSIKNDDGSTTEIKSDGSKTVTKADGSTVTTAADGSVTTKTADGKTTVTPPPTVVSSVKNADGSTTETKSDGSTTVTKSDGSSVTTAVDGSTITKTADGKTTVTPPAPVVSSTKNADGSTTQTKSDGSLVTTKSDGSSVATAADGTVTTTTADGKTTVTPAAPVTTVSTTKNGDGSTTDTKSDGSITTTQANGVAVTTKSDGTIVSTKPDGSVVTTRVDGSTTTKNADGSSVSTKTDGTTITANADGSIVTKTSDGTTATKTVDGATTTTKADGSKTVVAADGTTTVTTPDGKTVVTPPASGTAPGTTPGTAPGTSPGTPPSTAGGLTIKSTTSQVEVAEGLAFLSQIYDPALAEKVRALRDNTKNIETIVQSSKGSGGTDAASQYQAPMVLESSDEPTVIDGRRLADSTTSAVAANKKVDVLFCDVSGNAIWKWSASDAASAKKNNNNAVTSSTTSTTSYVFNADLCTAKEVVVKVTAYQSGCSKQNHPEGCDNVYYKGCGGLTVSPSSNQIVVARTGGRSLGVLSYKSVGSTCQGRVVDAIRTFRGKKFNSPTYAEYSQAGHLYFTDSPFGLATNAADFDGDTLDKSPLREIPFNGVYWLKNNVNGSSEPVRLVDCFMDRPNKIAFSPKQNVMYVTNTRKHNSYVKQFALASDGSPLNSSVLFNFTAYPELATEDGVADGIKVDEDGYIYVALHKGIYVLSPDGTLVGVLQSTQALSALAFGGGRMFITGAFGVVAQTSGVFPPVQPPKVKTTCA